MASFCDPALVLFNTVLGENAIVCLLHCWPIIIDQSVRLTTPLTNIAKPIPGFPLRTALLYHLQNLATETSPIRPPVDSLKDPHADLRRTFGNIDEKMGWSTPQGPAGTESPESH